nr:MAG TPA: hypothetical protein [Bacteriophage sp.]
MNFKEFESSFTEYLDSKRDCKNHECIAFIRDDETGDAFIAAHCTQDEAMMMFFVIARKLGITLKQLAYMCIAIDSDKNASKALEGLVKESNKQERLKKAIASVEKAKATTASARKADIASDNAKSSDESQKSPRDGEGDFDKDEIEDVISAVLMDVLKSLDD